MSQVGQELTNSNKTKNFEINDDIKVNKASFTYIFKESVYEICSNSTSHGVPNIIRANNFATRIFWLSLVVGATFGCIYCNFINI